MTVADRFFYFPIVGLLGIIGACLNLLKPLANNRKLKLIGYISVIVVIILLSVRSIVRNGNWYDELTLYSHDSKIYDSSGIETNLGADYFSKQDYKNALVHFEKSVDILPSELNLFNVGLGYETMGNLQKARYFYQKALLLKKYPTDKHKSIEINTIQRLAFVYLLSNENETARKFVQQQLTEFPKNGLLLEYLAISEYRLNNYSQALNDVIKAKQYISNKEIDYVYTQINTKQTIQIP
jgi:tetratricopeptide (TPR) repeat protein